MTRRKQRSQRSTSNKAFVVDSFSNFMTRTGLGQDNANSAGTYSFNPISRNRGLLEFAYRSSWIVGKAVDDYAEDMVREGIDIEGDIDPDQEEQLQRRADRLRIWQGLCDAIKWSRLYGGAVAVMMIDGQDFATPLNLDTIRKDQFKGIWVLDRWMVMPSLDDLIKDFGPDFGKPKYYTLTTDDQGYTSKRIHHSRVIRVDGVDLPYWQRIAENGWGQSVIERLYDRLIAFDSTTQGAAQLVYKAHLRTIKVKSLRELIAAGGKALDAFVQQMDMIRAYQSNEGLTLLDAEDEFEVNQYAFSGLDNVMLQFGQQISGALGIPLVRLFGQSPAGLNSTGESDMRNYYDNVKQAQEKRLRVGVGTIYNLLYRSEFGSAPPENFDFSFRSLWQLSDKEKSEIANNTANAIKTANDANLISVPAAMRELRTSGQVTGIFQGITDEDIEEAENAPPPMMGEMAFPGEPLPQIPGRPGNNPQSNPPQQLGAGKTSDAWFDSDIFDHDRWITVHPNGQGSTGSPVLIDEHGNIKAGMGGKFNGRNIKQARRGDPRKDWAAGSYAEKGLAPPGRKAKEWEGGQTWHVSHPDRLGYRHAIKSTEGSFKEGDLSASINLPPGRFVFVKPKGREYPAEKVAKAIASGQLSPDDIEPFETEEEKEKRQIRAGRKYLSVPYSEKDKAKKYGAKWDGEKKSWYFPDPNNVPEALNKWVKDGANPQIALQLILDELAQFDPEQVRMGRDVEKEHYDTTHGDESEILGIVLDHLKEDPQYYSKLLAYVEK